MSVPTGHQAREAVGAFGSEHALQAVIDDLLSNGFDRADLSLLASINSIASPPAGGRDPVRKLGEDPDLRTMPFISKDSISEAEGAVFSGFFYVGALAALVPVVVSGGALAAALLAVGLGGAAGGAIGAILACVIGEHHAKVIETQLDDGGLVLWVRTTNSADEQRAIDILTRHSAFDVHLHDLPDQQPPPGADTSATEYRGQTYAVVTNKGYLTMGAQFPNEQGAQAYIDRHNDREAIQAAEAGGFNLDAALTHPSAVFETPAQLVRAALPTALKIELLTRWAYAEKERDMATDDGMAPDQRKNRLQEIQNAILTLDQKSR